MDVYSMRPTLQQVSQRNHQFFPGHPEGMILHTKGIYSIKQSILTKMVIIILVLTKTLSLSDHNGFMLNGDVPTKLVIYKTKQATDFRGSSRYNAGLCTSNNS